MAAEPEATSSAVERKLYPACYKGGVASLSDVDPEIFGLIEEEQDRQKYGLELIASENFTSRAVMEAVGSCLCNKYSEGLPGKRYYGGNEVIDKLESLCQKRALELFGLDPEEWGVNVQPYSGSTANFAAMNAVLETGDRFMGLSLTDGGHLSHGFFRGHKAINVSAKYWASLPYHIDPETGLIDYDDLERTAKRFCPKLIIGGSSAYPRDWDYERLRKIADDVKDCLVMVDMAHFSGLVASKVIRSPFEFADFVTTTTHKSLRSTRAAMIFYRKALADQMNSSVFPGSQGGPHNHAIAGVAVALREALTQEFVDYSKAVVENCRAMAAALAAKGHSIVTGGTDTHLLLWDVRPHGVTGSKIEYVCDLIHVTVNKNTVHGDKSAMNPGGVRVGTPALTSRGFGVEDMVTVAGFLDEAINLTKAIAAASPTKKIADFRKTAEAFHDKGIDSLGARVQEFSGKFPIPGARIGRDY
jgi:glycine hydroxymethyltransferase